MTLPPITDRQRPGLSETLTGPRDPRFCTSCGSDRAPLTPWREHDPHDQPIPVVILLCAVCSRQLIEPHARLYRALQPNEPWPGCMALCLECTRRNGLRCTHPDLVANGGNGLAILIEPPMRMHVCRGRGRGGIVDLYTAPAHHCAGREAVA